MQSIGLLEGAQERPEGKGKDPVTQTFEGETVPAARTAGRTWGEGRRQAGVIGWDNIRGALEKHTCGMICRLGYKWVWSLGFILRAIGRLEDES